VTCGPQRDDKLVVEDAGGAVTADHPDAGERRPVTPAEQQSVADPDVARLCEVTSDDCLARPVGRTAGRQFGVGDVRERRVVGSAREERPTVDDGEDVHLPAGGDPFGAERTRVVGLDAARPRVVGAVLEHRSGRIPFERADYARGGRRHERDADEHRQRRGRRYDRVHR